MQKKIPSKSNNSVGKQNSNIGVGLEIYSQTSDYGQL